MCKYFLPSCCQQGGVTPLHLVAEGGHAEAIAALIGAGAAIDAKDIKVSCLFGVGWMRIRVRVAGNEMSEGYVCMCVCVHVCIYVCIYLSIYLSISMFSLLSPLLTCHPIPLTCPRRPLYPLMYFVVLILGSRRVRGCVCKHSLPSYCLQFR